MRTHPIHSTAPRATPPARFARFTMTALTAGAAVAALALGAAVPSPAQAADAQDFSVAEKALFMTDQLSSLRPPATLRYQFRKSGSLEPGYDDRVSVALSAQADGSCCHASGEFLSGERRVPMPEVDGAHGNPVIMFFLERDVREMQRLTKGSPIHFRKQIRMAVYDGATVREVSRVYRGQPIAARDIAFAPYLSDPNRPRFEKFANKQYVFTLSDAVPGGVVGIRTQVADAAAGAPPLLVEELVVDGAEPAAR